MASRTILWLLGLAVVAAAGWHYRNTEPLRSFLHPVRGAAHGVDKGSGSARPDRAAVPSPALKTMRKCLKDGRPIYTDETCPPGSEEQAMDGGTLTVLPAQPGALLPRSAPAAASTPTLRDQLLPPGDDNLRDKRIEKALQR